MPWFLGLILLAFGLIYFLAKVALVVAFALAIIFVLALVILIVIKAPRNYKAPLILVIFLLSGIVSVPFVSSVIDKAKIEEKNEYILVERVLEVRHNESVDKFGIIGWLGGNDIATGITGQTSYAYYIKSIIYQEVEYTEDDDLERLIQLIERGKMYYYDGFTDIPHVIKYRSGRLRLNLDKIYKE